MSQNHYQVLGVSATASAQEIKLAYKRLAIQFHPDKHGGSSQFEEQFKAVSAAYRTLSDPARRASYDHQLRAAALRADEARRQQQYRAQGQHVYGVPMPPAQPLRTRRPAGSTERHYQTIAKRRPKFTRRDYQLTAALAALLLLFIVSVKVTMDHVTAVSNYENGLRAYAGRHWSTAHGFFSEALQFKPQYKEALQRRAEIEQLVYRNYKAARNDYRSALGQQNSAKKTALLLFRLGQCQAGLAQKDSAQRSLTRALALDSTLSAAWLARGELRLFELLQFDGAVADLSAGLRQRQAAGQAASLKYLTYRGLAYYKMREFGAARADYREVLVQNPTNGQVHFLLGRLAQQEGNPAAACEFFRRAIQLGYLYAGEALQQNCP
ncbi:J domain-containing protein [Hymenobacter chitinivorans]|uniref:Tetratricopeptide repeat protein n=1 Tax=Hymenobacter chitinivorans DSM 11115 TaxID=1121954 RepID=A0A2M9ARR8_9BACT|nr:J domain-containing protein [Hymenobacter chitinivorans]PJJ48392.1 tetratricopeptide repeat protein [Hymenobacter chitinivorans DSM 11115]